MYKYSELGLQHLLSHRFQPIIISIWACADWEGRRFRLQTGNSVRHGDGKGHAVCVYYK